MHGSSVIASEPGITGFHHDCRRDAFSRLECRHAWPGCRTCRLESQSGNRLNGLVRTRSNTLTLCGGVSRCGALRPAGCRTSDTPGHERLEPSRIRCRYRDASASCLLGRCDDTILYLHRGSRQWKGRSLQNHRNRETGDSENPSTARHWDHHQPGSGRGVRTRNPSGERPPIRGAHPGAHLTPGHPSGSAWSSRAGQV